MKRTLPVFLTLCLALTACGGGGGQSSATPSKTPEELGAAYVAAIDAARDQETREVFPARGDLDDEEMELILNVMGELQREDVTAGAVAMSMRNVQAYTVAAFMPAQDKGDKVREALESYVEVQKNNFQFYLEEQYQVAADAKLETLKDGTVLLVMCDGQDAVFDAIKTALEG